MRITIIPLSYQTNIINTASERIRCDWLLPYLPADKFNGSQNLNDYDVIIYQKAYKPGIAEWALSVGKLNIMDLCDPIWLVNPKDKLWKMFQYMDAFIFSTEEMRVHFGLFFPSCKDKTYTVIDRLKLNEFKEMKVHEDRDSPILVWYGFSENFIRLSEMLPYIDEHKYPLVTICERPVGYGQFVKWSNDTVNKNIIKGDIVLNPLNPQYLKTSLNKTIQAWALGMPVISNKLNKFEHFSTRLNREEEQYIRSIWVKEHYDIRKSAKEINDIIYSIKNELTANSP